MSSELWDFCGFFSELGHTFVFFFTFVIFCHFYQEFVSHLARIYLAYT